MPEKKTPGRRPRRASPTQLRTMLSYNELHEEELEAHLPERKPKRGTQVLPVGGYPRFERAQIPNPYDRDDWRWAFLEEMAYFPNPTRAAAKAGVDPLTVVRERYANKDFGALWQWCLDSVLDQVEELVFQRAMNPQDMGSASLARWLLTTHRPQTYSPTARIKHEHKLTGVDGQPITMQIETVDYRNYLSAIAPLDRPVIEGERVRDYEDDDDDIAFRDILADDA